MKNSQVAQEFYDNSIRFESIVHFASMCIDYAFPDAAEDAFNQNWEEVWRAIGIDAPEDGSEEDMEYISDYLNANGKAGFLIQVATPIPEFHDKNSFISKGWGWYTTKWIYVENFEDAIPLAHEWKSEYIEKERAKQGY